MQRAWTATSFIIELQCGHITDKPRATECTSSGAVLSLLPTISAMQVKRKHRDVRERGVQRSHASGKKIGELREIIDLSCFNIVVLQTLSTRASAATVDSFRSISKHGDDRNKRKASSTPARAETARPNSVSAQKS